MEKTSGFWERLAARAELDTAPMSAVRLSRIRASIPAAPKSPRICLRCFKAIHLAQFYANKDSSIHILGKRGCR